MAQSNTIEHSLFHFRMELKVHFFKIDPPRNDADDDDVYPSDNESGDILVGLSGLRFNFVQTTCVEHVHSRPCLTYKGHEYMNFKGLKLTMNQLILENKISNEKAVSMLHDIFDATGPGIPGAKPLENIVLCANCAKLLGTKRCKGCPRSAKDTRYCGVACQHQHWPVHKLECMRLHQK